MNFAKTKEGTVEIPFTHTYEDESGKLVKEDVKIWVKRGSFTLDIQQLFAESKENPKQIATALADMIDKWDLDWNGEEWLPTAKNIAKSSDEFLLDLITAITDKFAGKRQKT